MTTYRARCRSLAGKCPRNLPLRFISRNLFLLLLTDCLRVYSGVKNEHGDGKKGFKDAQEEDEFGWVVKQGGWDKEKKLRRNAGGGPGSPLAFANQIVSPEIMAQLKGLAGGGGGGGDDTEEADDAEDDDALDELDGLEVPAGGSAAAPDGGSASPPAIIMAFVDAAIVEMEKWKNEAEAEIKKAGKNKGKLKKIQVPTGKFLEAGIKAALAIVLPLLEEIGGPVVDRAKALGIIATEGADGIVKGGLESLDLSALKRGFSQMLQEMVMDKVRHEVRTQAICCQFLTLWNVLTDMSTGLPAARWRCDGPRSRPGSAGLYREEG